MLGQNLRMRWIWAPLTILDFNKFYGVHKSFPFWPFFVDFHWALTLPGEFGHSAPSWLLLERYDEEEEQLSGGHPWILLRWVRTSSGLGWIQYFHTHIWPRISPIILGEFGHPAPFWLQYFHTRIWPQISPIILGEFGHPSPSWLLPECDDEEEKQFSGGHPRVLLRGVRTSSGLGRLQYFHTDLRPKTSPVVWGDNIFLHLAPLSTIFK